MGLGRDGGRGVARLVSQQALQATWAFRFLFGENESKERQTNLTTSRDRPDQAILTSG
jgi:hypothetical protein